MTQPIKDAIASGRMQDALEAVLNKTPAQQAALEQEYREQREREREQREQEREAQEREARRSKRAALLQSWHVPRKDVERILAGELARTDALDWAQRFMDQLGAPGAPRGRCMLVLSGPMGCGKTTAASWILATGIERWGRGAHDAMFVRAGRLVRWNRFDDAAMAQIEGASALVIDDLGSEYQDDKGAFRSFVDNVVDARYADQRVTVITTNLDADGFKARYGARFADRMREAGRFVELAGESMRRGRA